MEPSLAFDRKRLVEQFSVPYISKKPLPGFESGFFVDPSVLKTYCSRESTGGRVLMISMLASVCIIQINLHNPATINSRAY